MSIGAAVLMSYPSVVVVYARVLRWRRAQTRKNAVDEVRPVSIKERVVAPLEPDRRAGVGADSGTAGRPADVPRMNLDPIGQRQEPIADALLERLRELALLAVQIRSADGADEQRVACEDEPGILPARRVRDE